MNDLIVDIELRWNYVKKPKYIGAPPILQKRIIYADSYMPGTWEDVQIVIIDEETGVEEYQ